MYSQTFIRVFMGSPLDGAQVIFYLFPFLFSTSFFKKIVAGGYHANCKVQKTSDKLGQSTDHFFHSSSDWPLECTSTYFFKTIVKTSSIHLHIVLYYQPSSPTQNKSTSFSNVHFQKNTKDCSQIDSFCLF